MAIKNANSHPFQVEIVDANDDTFYANSHPYKVAVVGGHIGIEARIVDELPETGETGYIYLVLKEETEGGDIYDEYMWVLQQDGTTYGWEHIGATNEVTIKLYDTEGDNTDGAMTQRAATAMKGKARVLTAEDYNWPINNPTGIALWKLDVGLYTIPSGTTVYWHENNNAVSKKESNAFVFETTRTIGSSGYKNVFWSDVKRGYGDPVIFKYDTSALPSQSGLQNWNNGKIITLNDVRDDLTTSENSYALSARQGKVLNEKIEGRIITGAGAPTTSTVGTVGQIYEDTTNGKIFVLSEIVEESGLLDEYVWEELGGGVNQINSQDWSDLWQ